MSTRLPTFIIVGAARSGTTALYSYLRQHPEVFMSQRKETNFFAFEGERLDFQGPGAEFVNDSISTLEAYQALFEPAGEARAIGEASPLYLYAPKAPERIAARLPNVKLIAILRNPIEQAHSHYLYARRNTIEPIADFLTALEAEPKRLADHWQPMFQYSSFPRYGEQLERYLAVFPRDQLQVFLYEDLEADAQGVMAQIFQNIGVDASFVPDLSYRPNAGGVPKNETLQKLLMRPYLGTRLIGALLPFEVRRRVKDLIAGRNVEKTPFDPKARAFLSSALEADIKRTEQLIGRDLGHWLKTV